MLVLGRFDQVRLLAHRDGAEKRDWIVARCLTYFILTPVSYARLFSIIKAVFSLAVALVTHKPTSD
jgi:hypothetical protein